jgi:hypothetical protein
MARQVCYSQGGKQTRRVSVEQSKQLAQTGELPTGLPWGEGFAEWRPASAVNRLVFPETQAASTPLPPPLPGRASDTSRKLVWPWTRLRVSAVPSGVTPTIPPSSASGGFKSRALLPSPSRAQAHETRVGELPKTRRLGRRIALGGGGVLLALFLLGSLGRSGDCATSDTAQLNIFNINDISRSDVLLQNLHFQSVVGPVSGMHPENCIVLEKGTSLRSLKFEVLKSPQISCRYVRVMDGPNMDAEGWIVDEYIIRD